MDGNRIKSVIGRDGPANKSRLCVKGRFGFDYVNNSERLTKPLIRIKDKKKDASKLHLRCAKVHLYAKKFIFMMVMNLLQKQKTVEIILKNYPK